VCYSLEASFAVGAALAVVGFATIRKALRSNRSMLVFALFPAVFSLHQFIEGIVWFSIEHPFHASAVFRYSYIFIAFLVWPVLAPLASAVATTDHWWRRVWTFLFACGLALEGYLSMKLAGADGIEASVVGRSISYVVKYPTRSPIQADYAYAAITALPLLFFGNKVVSVIGVGVLATFVYSFLEMREVWFSVWCMAAAVFSGLFFFSIRNEDARNRKGIDTSASSACQ
jgi:hypothetical protein